MEFELRLLGSMLTSTYTRDQVLHLPLPPKVFSDAVFPSAETITKQQAFLKDFYRKRFNIVPVSAL